MWIFLVGLALQVAGGLAAWLLGRRPGSVHGMGAGSAIVGALTSMTGTALVLMGRLPAVLHEPWSVPYGALSLGIDGLSGMFLLAIAVVGSATALYGVGYLGSAMPCRKLGASWFFFNVLLASMSVVVTAQNGVLFLIAWEIMSIASFFLVAFEHERQEVRSAGWLYLIASHIGAAFLLTLFVLLGREAGSFEFSALEASSPGTAVAATAFVLALIGFGVKAAFVPVHVWLPEAHPAAPSHVSALMSGVMIKTGIYGIVRTLGWLGPAQEWWGWTLVGVGLTSGVLGVLFALAQHDLKRLLAYHSVENVGIIALGIGLGIVGVSTGHPGLAAAGFAGGLLHVFNHALFKALLFLGAGAVLHETGTRNLEHLGGLMRRMPVTGTAFLVGSVAIVGLPPLNGFVSEFLIYSGALGTGVVIDHERAAVLFGCAAVLALVGGLAAACFAKAFGIVFLGVERAPLAHPPSDPPATMRTAMILLAIACASVGLLAPFAVKAMTPVLAALAQIDSATTTTEMGVYVDTLQWVMLVSWVGVLLGGGLWVLRAGLLRGRPVHRAPTWDCGYAAPTARMQYTASSFAQPLLDVFGALVRSTRHARLPQGLFPGDASFATHAHDVWMEAVFTGLFRRASSLFDRFHWIQQGKVHLYVLYVVVTLVALLLWKLY